MVLKIRRGQGTIIAVMMTFLAIMFFYAIWPAAASMISSGENASNMTGSSLLISELLGTFIILGILISFIVYVIPQRTQGY